MSKTINSTTKITMTTRQDLPSDNSKEMITTMELSIYDPNNNPAHRHYNTGKISKPAPIKESDKHKHATLIKLYWDGNEEAETFHLDSAETVIKGKE